MKTRHPRATSAPSVAFLLGVATLAALITLPAPSQAQKYRISQRATVSQMLGATKVSLDYSRPLARGRADLFGSVVHWGELWTPGANEATVLDVSDTITLEGHSVPTGRWSMWVIPSQVGAWELVLDKNDSLFHTQRPELTDDQIRFPLEVRQDAPHEEALLWSFPRIAQNGGTMRLNWGTTQIDLDVAVKSIEPVMTVSASDAAPYLGKWKVTFLPNPDFPGEPPQPAILTISHAESGSLMASFPPGVFSPPPPPKDAPKPDESKMTPQERERAEAKRKLAAMMTEEFAYVLVPKASGVFQMGWMDDGVLYDVEEFYHEFELENGRAVRASFRSDKDVVVARAERVKE